MGRTGKVNTRISPGLHVRLDCNTRVHHLRRFRDVRLTRREDRHAILGLRWLDIGDLHLVTGHMERGYMPGQLPDDLLALLQVFLKIRGLVRRGLPPFILGVSTVKRLLRQPLPLRMLVRGMPASAVLAGIRFREDLAPGSMMRTSRGLAEKVNPVHLGLNAGTASKHTYILP